MDDLVLTIRQLYDTVAPDWEQFLHDAPTPASFIRREITAGLPTAIAHRIYEIAQQLTDQEPVLRDLPPIRADEEYLQLLKEKRAFLDDQYILYRQYRDLLVQMFHPFKALKPLVMEHSPFSMPLFYALPNPANAIDNIHEVAQGYVAGGYYRHHFFKALNATFHEDRFAAIGRRVGGTFPLKEVPTAKESKLSLPKMVEAYLKGTPFLDLFLMPVPVALGERSAHHLIIGGAGSGKTSMMEHLLLHDFEDQARPSIVLIDPHTDLVNRILSADLGLDDRIIYINYRDIEHPPQINIFSPNTRMAAYDQVTREQVSASVIETFEYLFTGLFNLALTGRQSTLFRYVARLMLTFPETMGRPATILDMLDLTDEKQVAQFAPAISRLPAVQREFFERDYIPAFKDTRQQIRGRLQALLDSPTLARLLSSQETKIDLFSELNRGCILLVDTAEGFLGPDGAATMGRLWISLILQAVLERQAIPEGRRRPTYLYIDEALTFAFDEKMASLLRETRKYGCGAVLASQELPQNTSVRSALSANTAIKMVCRPSASDAGALAPDMRTTKEFILAQPTLAFATYTPAVDHAVSVAVTPGTFANLRRRDPAAFIERNRERVSGLQPYPIAAEEGATFSPQPPSKDRHDEW